MTDLPDFKVRALANLKDRHEDKIREMAAGIQAEARLILADLDRGRVPRLRNLLDDAVKIATRIEALEAMAEMGKIYESPED